MDLDSVGKMLGDLEERIEVCENAAGIQNKQKPSLANTRNLGDQMTQHYSKNFVLEICRLQNALSKIIQGPILEFEEKYKSLEYWLENEQADASSIILTMKAKRLYILEHEDILKETTDQLKSVHDLEQFIHSQDLQEIDSYKKRLQVLELNGSRLSAQTQHLAKNLQQTAQIYGTTMNMLSALFKEWHDELTEMENEREAHK